jgi:hypothetical protein
MTGSAKQSSAREARKIKRSICSDYSALLVCALRARLDCFVASLLAMTAVATAIAKAYSIVKQP